MDAEWLALIHAIEVAQVLELTDPIFLGDSLAVVRQANSEAKCKGTSARYLSTLRKLSSGPSPLRIRHVKRSQNLAGIALARIHPR